MLSVLRNKTSTNRLPKIIFGKKELVGIDSGRSNVKLIKASIGNPTKVLCKSFSFSETVKNEITSYIKEKKLVKKKLALSLADENVENHLFKIPKLSPEEAQKAIEWEIKKVLPSSDFVIKDILTTETEDKINVECIIAPKDIVQNRYNEAKAYGLIPQYLETESSAILAYLMKINPGLTLNNIAVIDLGFSSFRIIFINSSRISFTRALYLGFSGLNSAQLLEDKEKRSIELVTLATMVSEEFERSVIFGIEKGLEKVNKVYLCGGGACNEKLVAELNNLLKQYEVSVLDPFKSGYFMSEEKVSCGPLWVCACGLVTR